MTGSNITANHRLEYNSQSAHWTRDINTRQLYHRPTDGLSKINFNFNRSNVLIGYYIRACDWLLYSSLSLASYWSRSATNLKFCVGPEKGRYIRLVASVATFSLGGLLYLLNCIPVLTSSINLTLHSPARNSDSSLHIRLTVFL
jgi:hypothetical protein